MRPAFTISAVLVVLAGSACGDAATTTTSTTTSATTSPTTTVTPTTTGAPAATAGTGYLIVTSDATRLCEVLLESYPPQCGGRSTPVAGLDVAEVAGTTEANGVVWTDRVITLLGTPADGVLHVPAVVTGSAITGRATAGPTCPVVRNPPDPACADRSVEGATIRVHGPVDVTATTDATGRFAIAVPAGDYTVQAQPVAGILGTPAPIVVTVRDAPVEVTLTYDTGIR